MDALDTVELMHCDLYGYSVVAALGGSADLLVDGGQWKPPGGHVHFQRMLREEQLFDIALRSA
ncbi:hypothetical protein [Cellulomonas algicola]|nr:hypothetical protein [Cellulomonas algicola]